MYIIIQSVSFIGEKVMLNFTHLHAQSLLKNQPLCTIIIYNYVPVCKDTSCEGRKADPSPARLDTKSSKPLLSRL